MDWARVIAWTLVVVAVILTARLIVRILDERASANAERVAHLRALLKAPAPEWIVGDEPTRRRLWSEVRASYAGRSLRLHWSHDGEPSVSARAFASALDEAAREGLDPADYGTDAIHKRIAAPPLPLGPHQKEPARRAAESARAAALDVRLTVAFVRYTRDLIAGRIPAARLDPDWIALRDTFDTRAALEKASRSARAARRVAELGRADEGYVSLRTALRQYRDLEARGGWPAIRRGPELRRGMQDERCKALRARLAATGDLPRASADTRFDAALERAVRRYQWRVGLDTTGRVNDETRHSLNVSVAERVRTLELNLERARWIPQVLPDPLIRVNIPQSELHLYQAGAESLSMRVVVGSPKDPTPVFSDVVTYLEFHPTWGVPKKILVNEMLPRFKKKKDYFLTNAIRVFDVHPEVPVEVDPRDVPWERVAEDTFPFIVRQDAGSSNPLGQIKFMCPNEYDVYLHDTSARRFFERSSRFLSHGCVRVQDPMALARYVLKDTPLAPPESLVAIMADSSWRRVGLKQRIPVLVEYRTAWVDSAGTVHFRPDVYGLDQRLGEALVNHQVSDFELNPLVLRNPLMPEQHDWAVLRRKR